MQAAPAILNHFFCQSNPPVPLAITARKFSSEYQRAVSRAFCVLISCIMLYISMMLSRTGMVRWSLLPTALCLKNHFHCLSYTPDACSGLRVCGMKPLLAGEAGPFRSFTLSAELDPPKKSLLRKPWSHIKSFLHPHALWTLVFEATKRHLNSSTTRSF